MQEVHRSSLDAMLPVYNTAVQMEGQKKGIAAAVDAAGQHARAAMHLRGRLDAMEAQLAALTAARRAQGAAVEEGSKGSSLRGMIEAQPFVDRRSHG